ncbi:Bax inhibitor-1/YccA family protein [uncultured Nocardioides sp.]|uniref:Bax inhibitor-1/YccA family protein n=1 Tax=uncultured Nocardioides sp. TaxID=198441 RepID=UPI0026276FD6|nr:Bax inhibitor-1/YccA family protein [uncultured Nocardioides sp.]
MRSSNPVFNRSAEFNGQRGGQGAGAPYGGYAQPGQYGQYGQGDPSQWDVAQGGHGAGYKSTPMTIDSVVQKTAISLGIVIVVALATWIITPPITDQQTLATVSGIAGFGAIAAFVLSMVNSFKRVVSPALVMAFAVFEGIALGALSKSFDVMFGTGVVSGAVFGTFAAFAGTLTAYKVLNIKVGDKFRKGVVAAAFGMIGLMLLSFVLSLFGVQTGLFGFGALGLLTAVAGLVLGVFFLILDFDFVEKGVAAGLDERESWRAAFGLTVSLVWIYINLLRILAIFSQD